VEDEVFGDVRMDEVEAVIVALAPVEPDFPAFDARRHGFFEGIDVDFAAEVAVVGALIYPQRQRRGRVSGEVVISRSGGEDWRIIGAAAVS